MDGLRDREGRGRGAKLAEGQLGELARLVREDSPEAHGYNSATWTGPLLRGWVEKTYGVAHKKAQIYNILKKLGFTHKKGRGAYPESGPGKQGAFKETLKKTPGKP